MELKSFHAIVTGRVQGVNFRESTRQKAAKLGVSGWVRNLVDGSVEVYCAGEDQAVEKLKSWLHGGPSYARVDRVDFQDVTDGEVVDSFVVRY